MTEKENTPAVLATFEQELTLILKFIGDFSSNT